MDTCSTPRRRRHKKARLQPDDPFVVCLGRFCPDCASGITFFSPSYAPMNMAYDADGAQGADPESSPMRPLTLQYILGRGDWKFETVWLEEQRDYGNLNLGRQAGHRI